MTRPWSPRGVVVAAAGLAVAALLVPSSPRGAPSPLRVMPLGDSITDGFNVPGGYRIELEDQLLASGLRVNFVGSLRNGPATLADGNHEGHSGWRIDELHGSVAGWLRTYRPHVVLLLIGTNDIIQEHRVATAPARLAALLDRVHCALPATRIVVSTIPPLADAGDDAQATAYNAALARLVRARAARRLPVSFVDAGRRLTLADLDDGVHPSEAGYGNLARSWNAAVRSALARTSKPPRDACR